VKNDLNVSKKCKKQKNLGKIIIFVVTDRSSRIRIRIHLSEVWIRGSGSIPKLHGSATLKFIICAVLEVHELILLSIIQAADIIFFPWSQKSFLIEKVCLLREKLIGPRMRLSLFFQL
jgi:hypothetical protein